MPQENISFSQLFKANATSPQLPEIYIYRKGAARNWRLDLSHLQLDLGACSNASGLFASPTSRTDTALLYGAGLQVRLAAMALRVEFERLSDSHGGLDLLSVGALWTF
ncbi:MAG TPA: hypothetical protein VIY90_10170 [Steroidobacteraceae bacterium]